MLCQRITHTKSVYCENLSNTNLLLTADILPVQPRGVGWSQVLVLMQQTNVSIAAAPLSQTSLSYVISLKSNICIK